MGSPGWGKWKRLQTQGHLSVDFNDEFAAAFPAKVSILCTSGREAKGLWIFAEMLIFNLQHLQLPQQIQSSCLTRVQASARGGEGGLQVQRCSTGINPELRQEEQ